MCKECKKREVLSNRFLTRLCRMYDRFADRYDPEGMSPVIDQAAIEGMCCLIKTIAGEYNSNTKLAIARTLFQLAFDITVEDTEPAATKELRDLLVQKRPTRPVDPKAN